MALRSLSTLLRFRPRIINIDNCGSVNVTKTDDPRRCIQAAQVELLDKMCSFASASGRLASTNDLVCLRPSHLIRSVHILGTTWTVNFKAEIKQQTHNSSGIWMPSGFQRRTQGRQISEEWEAKSKRHAQNVFSMEPIKRTIEYRNYTEAGAGGCFRQRRDLFSRLASN